MPRKTPLVLLLASLLGLTLGAARDAVPPPPPAPAPPAPAVRRALAITGLTDGARLRDEVEVRVRATDPGGVTGVRLYIDDLLVDASKGATLTYRWNARGLEPGEHVLDAVATGAAGERWRRRLRVHAGDPHAAPPRTGRLAAGVRVAPAAPLGEVVGRLELVDGGAAHTSPLAPDNARVELVDRLGQVVMAVRSAPDGRWEFSGVRGGHYRVRVNKRGFVSDERPLHVEPGRTVRVALKLSGV